MGEYTGSKRRFEYTGTVKNGAVIYHDYAHHPIEVKATLKTAQKRVEGRVIAVMQPHTYTRTKALLNDFSKSFDAADFVIVTDIYAAREIDDGTIHSQDLVNKITEHDKDKKCFYADSFRAAADKAFEMCGPDDIIITLGAGDIEKVNRLLKDYE